MLLSITVNESIINSIIAAFAIFVGFLINIVILLIPHRCKENDVIEEKLVKHLHYNTMYSLLVSIIIISYALLSLLIYDIVTQNLSKIWHIIGSGILYFFIVHFLISLLLIVRRVYALFEGRKQ